MKKYYYPLSLLVGCVVIVAWIAIWNYYTLAVPLAEVKKSEPSYEGADISVHYKYYVLPFDLVFDVRNLSENTKNFVPENIFIQFALKLKDKKFNHVYLMSKGQAKFQMDGHDFNTLNFIADRKVQPSSDKDLDDLKKYIGTRYFLLNVLRRPDGSSDGRKAFDTVPPEKDYLGLLAINTSIEPVFYEEWFGADSRR